MIYLKNAFLIMTILFCTLINLMCSNNNSKTQWPTNGWVYSSPEKQMMNSDSLELMSKKLASGDLGYIDGMLVIRNGKIIFEKSYSNPYDSLFKSTNTTPGKYNYYDSNWHPFYKKTELHTLQSISKSFTAAAVGIAIQNGAIPSVNEKLNQYLPNYTSDIPDQRRDNITLKDILTMTTGIMWDEVSMPYTDTSSSCVKMEASNNWVQYVLSQPMAFSPGDRWEYNSGATMLLSHIMKEATGEDLAKYLEKNLFNALGINNYFWKHTPTGLTDAEGGLYLVPKDLAKFGYLYLNNGKWDDKQILPENWVTINTENPLDTPWPALKYGYQWWLIPYENGGITLLASGLGGQRLLVIPEFNIVAVFTGWNVYDKSALDSWWSMNRLINAIIQK